MVNNKIAALAINEQGFVFDPSTGNSFTCNETGRFILSCLAKGQAAEEVISSLMGEYEGKPKEIERDVQEFIHHLRLLKLM